MKDSRILLGNEAIAYGILGSNVTVVTSYPGTPASEICETAFAMVKEQGLPVHVEWSINEKTAFEIAYANAIAGRRSAVSMKQVGLNVASDPVMSAAYMGTAGGLLLIVADDPGPHSSQTEQDTRLFALYAKIPVLDPSSPEDALRMTLEAFAFSEEYRTPVILRPTTRVCHARQLMEVPGFRSEAAEPDFRKDPSRWAATPGPRLVLHRELNAKIARIRTHAWARPRLTMGDEGAPVAVVSSGVGYAYLSDVLAGFDRWPGLCVYKVDMPYPMDPAELDRIASRHQTVLVIEETEPVMELQFTSRGNVRGRMDGTVPNEGELTPEIVMAILDRVTEAGEETPAGETRKGRRPSLCPGCSHRGAFYAIKRALPKGIYTSDIGCYTLGLNLGAVDTCLCMGAAVSQAAGFYHAYKHTASPPPIAAIIGDSTYFHAGIPPTINALVTGARFVLVILDNATTAMTGHQPTPATGHVASDYEGRTLELEEILRGCGIRTVTVHDPYDVTGFKAVMKDAYARTKDEGVTAVIARHPCIRDRQARARQESFVMEVTDECTLCGVCVKEFECPGLSLGEEKAVIDMTLCIGCGVCAEVCPSKAITAGKRP
ncbi:MAG TPA: thiamine pyrophosphate-dependent enzyme [Deltaproteobacteria bacterium]|nr:thiamine pyrophosphate-dependent enzyme [Deltaproteobacteria bacterium]HXK47424.1 thiamine pyrophosphate-dependent enzyme [Deltaproteobacteria bacterium]